MIAEPKSLALIALGRELKARHYQFVAITPRTHQRIFGRQEAGSSLTSIFGWNWPFVPEEIDASMLHLLTEADALEEGSAGHLKSRVRFATIGDLLFVHSGFPTVEVDAVFFGPDTYRFARALAGALRGWAHKELTTLVDIGAGSGAGGIYAGRLIEAPVELVLADINPRALTYCEINAAINDCASVRTISSNVLDGFEGDADVIIANPPYLIDPARRVYRHGGGPLGFSLALQVVQQGLPRLAPSGLLVLYTGVPIVNGEDIFFQSLAPVLQLSGCRYSYEEVDPDVFGEELDREEYAAVDRIAVVVLTATKE
jgi:methylase of polypeptide subunit release factors